MRPGARLPARRRRRAAWSLDLADARIVRALLAGVRGRRRGGCTTVMAALARKDAAALRRADARLARRRRATACARCCDLYGDDDVLDAARAALPARRRSRRALDDLALAGRATCAQRIRSVRVGFDLADLRGYAYYSGARFALYAPAPATRWCAAAATTRSARSSAATARPSASASTCKRAGRRGRPRGAAQPRSARRGAKTPALRAAVRRLREQGETVVCMLPGHEHEGAGIRLRPRTRRRSADAGSLRAL